MITDLSIQSDEECQQLKAYLKDMHVIWIIVDQSAEGKPVDLSLSGSVSHSEAAKKIMALLQTQYRYAESYARWVPERIPVLDTKPFGKIVLLIGSSSSGKSTLASNIQNMAPEVFLNVGVDTAVLEYTHLRYIAGVPENKDDNSWQSSEHETSEDHKQGSSWVAAGISEQNPHPHLRFRMGPGCTLII